MGRHILQLNFPDCTNEGVFLIDDISIYDGGSAILTSGTTGTYLPVTCPNLQITPPGFISPTQISIIPSSHIILNACSMGVLGTNACSDGCPNLPDGMYNVRYSVSPNDQVYVEYKVMRITSAWNRCMAMLCKLNLECNLPDKDLQYQLSLIDIIKNYLLSAKVTVENEHQFTDGMNQYRYAVQLMDKMSYHPKRC
jgi:hypothetical protein